MSRLHSTAASSLAQDITLFNLWCELVGVMTHIKLDYPVQAAVLVDPGGPLPPLLPSAESSVFPLRDIPEDNNATTPSLPGGPRRSSSVLPCPESLPTITVEKLWPLKGTVTKRYSELCQGHLPIQLKEESIPRRGKEYGPYPTALREQTRVLPDSSFSKDDPHYVLSRLPLLERIFGEILETPTSVAAESGMIDESMVRRPWDQLVHLVVMRATSTNKSCTQALHEVAIEACCPYKEDVNPSLVDTSGVDRGSVTSATPDAMLVYKASRPVDDRVDLAAYAKYRAELSFCHHTHVQDLALRIILLAFEWKLRAPEVNARQAVISIATMQRHLEALGITGQISYALAGDVARLWVLGGTQDAHGIIHIFICDVLDMRLAEHYWKHNFFLVNMESWGRTELEKMLAPNLSKDGHGTGEQGVFRLPQKKWRFDEWHSRRIWTHSAIQPLPKKRKRHHEGDRDGESNDDHQRPSAWGRKLRARSMPFRTVRANGNPQHRQAINATDGFSSRSDEM
ncbi:hypothetical protein DACRYDRAFT_23473, partial [Dacryopinax primogenitus]